MRKLTDQELKAEFVSPKNQLRVALYGGAFLVLVIAVFAVLFKVFKDPFDWMTGSPPVREAKKWLVLCILFVLGPALAGVWFLIIRPLQTGVVAGGSKHRAPYIVLRSEEPDRFRGQIWWNCIKVGALLGLAIWLLFGFVRDLKKALDPEPSAPDAALSEMRFRCVAQVSGAESLIRCVGRLGVLPLVGPKRN